jgi:hypothetical protein
MYIPHKQDSVEKDIALINSMAYKNCIDKNDIMRVLNCSEKTAERRLKKIGLIHTKNHIINLLKDYENGLTAQDLALKYNCSEVNVNAIAKRHNFSRPIDWLNTVKANYYYFDKIDNECKAYILGFIAADGYVGNNEIKIGLSFVDFEILEKIKICLESNAEIKTYTQICTLNNKVSKFCSLSFANHYMINSLRSLGFTKNKTNDFAFPNIPKELYLHFLRGYFDGDGSMSMYRPNDGYIRYSASICGTESFLNSVKEYFKNEYSIKFNTNLYKRFETENCCYSLCLTGKNNVITFLNLLYKNSSIHLDRKYSKYLSFK